MRKMMEGMHVGWIAYINPRNDLNLLHLAGASNKAFDYLSASLPLIVPDAPEWVSMFVRRGVARECDAGDPESIAMALRWFYESPALAAKMGKQGCELIETEWNYERQFAEVAACINRRRE